MSTPTEPTTRAKNRLARARSPYLRQHEDNPVDWYEWGPEALELARREARPILLSVGYSACHWCHVMAHESFEHPAVAALMNEHYVNIKVDREERPDIDAIYQRVVQLMGEGGGWPLTVFLTPDQRPFYAGTYFPRTSRYGRPGFTDLLVRLAEIHRDEPEQIERQASSFVEGISAIGRIIDEDAKQIDQADALWSPDALRLSARRLVSRVDPQWGGFGREPKFPNPTGLELLLRQARTGQDDPDGRDAGAALQLTLEKMYRGGIYDHLRGGFARYAVDRIWLTPHFEKMLYDNAQLLALYAEASVLWPRPDFRKVVLETVEYLVADMRNSEGVYHAATDADSEGEEGKYFCWTPAQVAEVLEDESLALTFSRVYGVTDGGNFEHEQSILNLADPIETHARQLDLPVDELKRHLGDARSRLLEARYERIPPHLDAKALTAWNALLVSGLCRASTCAATWGDAGRARGWQALAVTAARRLLDAHVTDGGCVMRACFEGEVHTRGYLDDVAFLARACLDLHELTLEPTWLESARRLAEHGLEQYARPEGGFYLTAADGETLIERTESQHDAAIPAGVGPMLEVLLRLDLAGAAPPNAREIAETTLARFRGAGSQPFAYASTILAATWARADAVHVTIRGPEPADEVARGLARAVRAARLRVPVAVGLSFEQAEPASAVVCRGQACTSPITDTATLEREIGSR